jgi:hypothetical protein
MRVSFAAVAVFSCQAKDDGFDYEGGDGDRKVTFKNLSPTPLALWYDDGGRAGVKIEDLRAKTGVVQLDTQVGHRFFVLDDLGDEGGFPAGHRRDFINTFDWKVTSTQSEYTYDPQGCVDKYPSFCEMNARGSGCDDNPGWMQVQCPVSCKSCDLLDPKVRCSRERLNITDVPSVAGR